MIILAIDTAETHCSAALLLADGTVHSARENLGRGHAERLLPMIEELLDLAAAEYEDIMRIAVTTGPGTFTGLRIGLSVARGLALALQVPCVGVSSLVCLAAQAPLTGGPVHAVVKGRGGQVYYQAFEGRGTGGLPVPVTEAENIDAHIACDRIEERSGYVIGSGVPLIMGREIGEMDGIDPGVLAGLAPALLPDDFPPEPYYLRAADAVKAKPIIKILET